MSGLNDATDVRSAPGMTFSVNGFQTTVFNMGIYLCCADARMSQHFLECPNICTAGE